MKGFCHMISGIFLIFLLFTSCTTMQETAVEEEQVQSEEELEAEDAPSNFAQFEQLEITKGDHGDKIVLTWDENSEAEKFVILRALKKDEPFTMIKEVQGAASYTDADVEPGRKVYYRLILANVPDSNGGDVDSEDEIDREEASDGEFDDTPVDYTSLYPDAFKPESEDQNHANFGYAKAKKPRGSTIAALSKNYTKGKSGSFTAEEKKYQQKHLAFLKDKYQHPVKLNMMLTMTSPYINSGRLEVHRGVTAYNHNRDERKVYMFNEDHSAVYIFMQYIVSESLVDAEMKSLFERLMKNSAIFCGYKGEKEVVDENGVERILPAYDVVALAAQYWPQYRNWKKSTYLIVTSDKRLKREIQRAQQN